MIKALLVFLFLTGTASAGFLDDIGNTKPLHGVAHTAKSLKGKVIFLEYWGLN
jgi:hypothetical protein